MTPYEKLNPEDDAFAKSLASAANEINPNLSFQNELEKRLTAAHRPKRSFAFPLREKILPTLSWTVALVALALILNWASRSLSASVPAFGSDFICPVTEPNGSLPPNETVESPDYLGNGKLWTSLWPDGKVMMEQYNQEADGSFSMKWGWVRAVTGPLTIEGQRLDKEAPPLRADIPDGYGDTGFQVSALIFPTTGCWEVTGRVGDASLTFVTEVVFGEAIPTPDVTLAASPSTPTGDAYNWNGIKLYMDASLPESPVQASVYVAQAEQPATLESVRALANQFGMNGQIYVTDGEIAGTTNLAVVDGRQRLYVRSDRYFVYYADYTASTLDGTTLDNPSAKALIDEFMKSHGFDFAYRVEQSELYGGYIAMPLAADGFALHLDYFKENGLLFKFNDAGIVQVEASLMKYDQVGIYGVRTAQQALDQLLNPNAASIGVISNMHSTSKPPKTWVRIRPQDTTVTIYGWMKSIKSAEGGAALVSLDGYTATGSLAGIAEEMPNTFVEATGKFHTDTFVLESWKVYNGNEDGLEGTLQRQGDQVLLTTTDNEIYTLPDIPADLSLPTETVFVIGIKRDKAFEWKSFDLRAGQGGGGGGGGGTGIRKLNLTGTPMPFPTAETPPQSNGGGGGAFEVQHYTVQEGDTLTKIASQFGVTVDELMQANSFSNSTIYVGQNIVIPIGSLTVGQKIEGQRGIFSTTIFKQTDGSQRTQYNFITNTVASGAMLLIGDNLQDLQKDNGLPIVIWGTIDQINQQGIPVIKVDRYEIPFPDLKYKILKGTESSANVQGQAALLFNNAEDGKTYVQLSTNCSDLVMQAALLNPGLTDSQILLEALAVPDLTFGGYPTLCTNNKAMAINPKNGKPMEMTITADQPYIVDESTSAGPGLLPTATIEKVELIYYVADPRYAVTDPAAGQPYIQPMWRFTGHYSTGDEFEILVQALKDEFLSPEIQTIQGPG